MSAPKMSELDGYRAVGILIGQMLDEAEKSVRTAFRNKPGFGCISSWDLLSNLDSGSMPVGVTPRTTSSEMARQRGVHLHCKRNRASL
jgi:hypothetical protein